MTIGDVLFEVGELGNQSDRVQIDLVRFINRAQQRICQRRNWSFCHDQRSVTLPQGQLGASIDRNFKQLSTERSAVTYQDPTVNYQLPIPCEVISRAEANRRGLFPWGIPFPAPVNAYPLRYVFIEKNGPNGAWMLYIPQQYTTSPTVTFMVSGYYYPNDLKNADDHSGVTDHPELCDALINLTKALTYFSEDTKSEDGMAAMALYEQAYKLASYSDSAQRYQARQLNM